MSAFEIDKEAAGVEDLALGMGIQTQERGEVTEINAEVIPYSETETTKQAIDRKEDTADLTAKLLLKANLNGNVLEQFVLAAATLNEHGINLLQLIDGLAPKEDTVTVDGKLVLKADLLAVLRLDGLSDPFSPTSDNQPATKKYVDDNIIAGSGADMQKSIYDTDNNGCVDSTDGIGHIGDFLGLTPHNQVMRLSQSNVTDCNTLDTFGIFVGTDVTNAPSTGPIGLEQLALSAGKAQRCFAFATSSWYSRFYGGTSWTVWVRASDENDIVRNLGGSANIYAVLHAEQGKLLNEKDLAQDNTIALKEDTTSVNDKLAFKADTTYVDTGLGTKPNSVQEAGVGISLGNQLVVTQAQYDALTPVATTFYIIVG